jgi:hypothetical protein
MNTSVQTMSSANIPRIEKKTKNIPTQPLLTSVEKILCRVALRKNFTGKTSHSGRFVAKREIL